MSNRFYSDGLWPCNRCKKLLHFCDDYFCKNQKKILQIMNSLVFIPEDVICEDFDEDDKDCPKLGA